MTAVIYLRHIAAPSSPLHKYWVTRVGKVKRSHKPKPVMSSESLSVRELNKLDKRERIRAAALDAFVRDGFDGASIGAIAEQAGVAKGTVFLYAEDKRDLLCLVMHDLLEETLRDQLATLPKKAPIVDQLMHVFGGLFRMYGHFPGLAREFVRAFPGATGPNGRQVGLITLSFQQQLAELLRVAAERGQLRPELPLQLAANNVFALYFGALMAWVGDFMTAPMALDALLRPSLELAMEGLAPRSRA